VGTKEAGWPITCHVGASRPEGGGGCRSRGSMGCHDGGNPPNTYNIVGNEGGTETHWLALEARAERQAKARGDGQAGPSLGPNNDEN
jgi:hypothetical protein